MNGTLYVAATIVFMPVWAAAQNGPFGPERFSPDAFGGNLGGIAGSTSGSGSLGGDRGNRGSVIPGGAEPETGQILNERKFGRTFEPGLEDQDRAMPTEPTRAPSQSTPGLPLPIDDPDSQQARNEGPSYRVVCQTPRGICRGISPTPIEAGRGCACGDLRGSVR